MSEKNQQLRCLIEQCRKPMKSNSPFYTLKLASLAWHEMTHFCLTLEFKNEVIKANLTMSKIIFIN